MTERLYFDWNASAPLRDEARAAVVRALETPGNASSVHAEGRAARGLIEAARGQVAQLVGGGANNITFTSGATEANMLALTPAIETAGEKRKRDRLFVSAIEHPSVLCGGRFSADAVEKLPVTADGIVDVHALRSAIARAERPLISVMLANNETGVIQPIVDIAAIVHAANGLLHVDAVQAPGRMACDIAALGADMLTISSHKLGGPQGAGALIRRGDIHISEPLIKGGGQERGYRAGTENVAAIAGFGATARAAGADLGRTAEWSGWRDRLAKMVTAGASKIGRPATIFGSDAPRLPQTLCFAAPGLSAEILLIALDLAGVAVSSGSACSSGKVAQSHVLAAMGVTPELARGAIRLSLGWESAPADLDLFATAWEHVLEQVASGAVKAA